MSNSGSRTHRVSQGSKLRFSSIEKKIHKSGNSKFPKTDKNPKTDDHPPRRQAQVIDADANDVTPLPMLPANLGDMPSKLGGTTLDGVFPNSGSSYSKSSWSSSVSSSRFFHGTISDGIILSNLFPKVSTTEDSLHVQDMNLHLPASSKKTGSVEEHVAEETLDQVVDIILTETDTFTLLDIPSTLTSEEAADGEEIKKRNIYYAELCKNRMGNDNYSEISTQTLAGLPKTKQIQTDKNIIIEKGTTATVWDIYDSFCAQNKTSENDTADHCGWTVSTKRQKEKKEGSRSGSGDTEMETSESTLDAEPFVEEIMLSEKLKNSLVVIERNVLANNFQPKLAAYRNLPILKDPHSMVEPEFEEHSEEDQESFLTPMMESLWTFAYELTRGCDITSMTWSKTNPDILAVGYGDCDSNSQKPGFICCWSIKNPTYPERFLTCHRSVTSLDFSANNPSRLAVGMCDGSVAIYNVQIQDRRACIASSSECPKRHLLPVWKVIWTKQELKLSGEERQEVLVSASEDGRITKWFIYNNCLDCIDLMKLKNRDDKKEGAGKKKTTKRVKTAETPCRSVDFHPTDSGIYLVSSADGFIHKCSISNSDHFLDTYKNHIGIVSHVEWSSFNTDVFLSCSSDFTIQVWKQSSLTPVLSATSIKSEVCTAHWSPNCSTVFAALYKQQVDIWDLNSNILQPTIVHHAAPGVELTSLLFARGSDSVLVGDSEGKVTVYTLNNLKSGADKQMDILDVIQSGSK